MQTDDFIGRRFLSGRGGEPVQVIGLVQDGKYVTLTEQPRPVVFWSIHQRWSANTMLLVRSERPFAQVLQEMKDVVAALDPALPTFGGGRVEQLVGMALLPNRIAALALTAFGLLALLLAGAGVHGLVAYAVARREREIGIRLAIGATAGQVLRLVLTHMVALVAGGVVAGVLLSLAIAPLLARVAYQGAPRDPRILLLVGLTLTALAVSACWAPVRRALRIDPAAALRMD